MFYEIIDIAVHPGQRVWTAGNIVEIFDRQKPLVEGDPWIITALVGYSK
jgi:hypothetical protein